MKLLQILNAVPAEVWSTLLTGLFASPAMLGFNKWLRVNSDFIRLLNVIGAVIAVPAIIYLQSDPKFGPWLVAAQAGIAFMISQPVWLGIVKPIRSHVREQRKINAAEAAAKASAKMPAGGLTFTKPS